MSGIGDTPHPHEEHGLRLLERSAEHGFTFARRSAEHGFTFSRRSAEHGFTFSRRSAEHGFTLIEALVVVAVSALVAGIGFPRIEQSLSAWRMQSSASAVRAMLEDTRAQALRTGAPARFALDTDRQEFARSGKPAARLQPSVQFRESSRFVDFFGDGSSSGGRIFLEAPSGRRAIISVSADTGLIGTVR